MTRVIIGCLTFCLSTLSSASDPSTFFGNSDSDAYVDWYNTRGSISYPKNFYIESSNGNDGAAIHWKIDGDKLRLAVAARAIGWVGFGIAENGGMRGADMVLFTGDDQRLVDAHVLEQLLPVEDACNNWVLLYSQTDGGFLIFEAERLLDTGDPQDRAIIPDDSLEMPPQRVIAAWGDTNVVSYHGLNNRVRGTVRFFAPADEPDEFELFQQAMLEEAEGSFELRASNHPVQDIDTEYAYYCLTGDGVKDFGVPLDEDLHMVGAEPIIDPVSSKYVHHFIVYGTSDDELPTDGECEYPGLFEIVFVWAPGEPPFQFPENVGVSLGSNGYKEFAIEIHYNNPWRDRGVRDSSGIKFYYTTQKRAHDMGILPLGDPLLGLYGRRVGNGLIEHTFSCPESCSRAVIPEEVTVIRESLHMHRSGVRMSNSQIRNGEVIHTGWVDFFDFDQQGSFQVVQPPFVIRPGDSFQTTCQYRSAQETFGLSSQEEMCIAFLFYYPQQFLFGFPFSCGYGIWFSICASIWERQELDTSAELERTFGRTAAQCLIPPTPAPVEHGLGNENSRMVEPGSAGLLVRSSPDNP